jgi:hypothetical protein
VNRNKYPTVEVESRFKGNEDTVASGTVLEDTVGNKYVVLIDQTGYGKLCHIADGNESLNWSDI